MSWSRTANYEPRRGAERSGWRSAPPRRLEDTMTTEQKIIRASSAMSALEKAKTEKEAHGEFETEHPGYCGAQDTFYVGTLKGVGRIYQQTFIDTYAKVAFAKLYDRKTPSLRPICSMTECCLSSRSTMSATAHAHRPRDRVLRQSESSTSTSSILR